ncbi:hypothetical protein NOV72_00964 [Caballeronia novacaledonica]|uniref:Uncharacterized protein n=1 Tax=Caballeronia novacaledonica TaxID=1544861 RepID=A0A2U3I0S3_9BURK|nr:hypothetical protein NOV72_00964 [Caballeronia novacaledonica]
MTRPVRNFYAYFGTQTIRCTALARIERMDTCRFGTDTKNKHQCCNASVKGSLRKYLKYAAIYRFSHPEET